MEVGTDESGPELVCPRDREPLQAGLASGFRCPACSSEFPVEDGVVRFLERADAFYEGRYLNTIRFVPRDERLRHAWPLWQINSGYLWAARAHLRPGAPVVEVGCASGVAYFAQRFRMVGVDLSAASLARVAPLYGTCLQADITQGIPLPSGSVAGVLSSYVWEHIPPEHKPAALAELRRILEPGGKLVFLYDVESENPIYRAMKRRDRALYREVLIDREGHLGWQDPQENRTLFEEAGFRVLEHRGKEKLLISPAMYDKVQHFGGWLAPLARLGLRLRRTALFYGYNAALRAFDESLGRWLPESWSRVVLSVCEKR